MPDITMCEGGACPLKDKCYRHVAEESRLQSFFVDPPYNEDTQKCEYYWRTNLSDDVEEYPGKVSNVKHPSPTRRRVDDR